MATAMATTARSKWILLLLLRHSFPWLAADSFSLDRPFPIFFHPSLEPVDCRRRRRPRTAFDLQATAQQGLLEDNSPKWYPRTIAYDDDIFCEDDATSELEARAVQLAADLVRKRLQVIYNSLLEGKEQPEDNRKTISVPEQVRGRFMDLTCDVSGERALESLFAENFVATESAEVIQATVMVVQSLCIMGMCVGLKGPPEQLKRGVSHLDSRDDPSLFQRDLECWDSDSVRRLKYRMNRTPAMQLLSELRRKQSPSQGAFDLLIALGAWKKHEDLALLRSGFPLRFTDAELASAAKACDSTHDADELLGIRKDLRDMKAFTIDSASTSEIDDGLSIEVIRKDDGSENNRIWIHIADVDRYTDEDVFSIARKRVTSLYLPSGSCPMFPASVSTELMSLIANKDACALSLGVELNDDGSVNVESVTIIPTRIHVSYRLSYDEVDEMLEEGTGYSEEWELGAMLDAATKRREFRIKQGSTEGLVPTPIPYATISIYSDTTAPDGIAISHSVQVSHNAGKNRTVGAAVVPVSSSALSNPAPVSSAYLLVTEMMILAGEAIGLWKRRFEEEYAMVSGSSGEWPNQVRLPFRTQPKPDFKSRAREKRIMMDLLEFNVGNGLCQAWYSRRFFQSVKVTDIQFPHAGLGLSSYVQWTSPIRRFTDLQVHVSVKRVLRRKKVYQLMKEGSFLPAGISDRDLGFPDGTITEGKLPEGIINADDLDQDLNFQDGLGLVGAARNLQRQSQQYWMYEYIRRLVAKQPDTVFSALVLGCVDPQRRQYAIYVDALGLEHRYTSPGGRLDSGMTLQLKVDSVSPRSGSLFFVRVV